MRYTVYKRRVTTYKGVLGTARVSQPPPGRCHVAVWQRVGSKCPEKARSVVACCLFFDTRTVAAPGTDSVSSVLEPLAVVPA